MPITVCASPSIVSVDPRSCGSRPKRRCQVLLADHDHAGRPWTVLVVGEIAAGDRRCGKCLEETGRRPCAADALRRIAAGEGQAARAVGAHLFEHAIAGPPVDIARMRRRAVLEPRQLGAPDLQELTRVWERNRRQQHRVDDAEERGVDAGPEGQRQQGRGGDAGEPPQQPCTVANVLPESLHGPFDGVEGWSVDPGIVPAFSVEP